MSVLCLGVGGLEPPILCEESEEMMMVMMTMVMIVTIENSEKKEYQEGADGFYREAVEKQCRDYWTTVRECARMIQLLPNARESE